jgi:hypothetical protein
LFIVKGFKQSLDQMVKVSREETRLSNLEVAALKAELSSDGAAVVAELKAGLAAKQAEMDALRCDHETNLKTTNLAVDIAQKKCAELVEQRQELAEVRRTAVDTPEVKRLTGLLRETESRFEKSKKEAETKNRNLALQVVTTMIDMLQYYLTPSQVIKLQAELARLTDRLKHAEEELQDFRTSTDDSNELAVSKRQTHAKINALQNERDDVLVTNRELGAKVPAFSVSVPVCVSDFRCGQLSREEEKNYQLGIDMDNLKKAHVVEVTQLQEVNTDLMRSRVVVNGAR